MRVAMSILLLAATALSACNKSQPPQDQNIAVTESNAPAEVETLPADESDTTPSNQLVKGEDNPDINSSTSNGD